MRLALVRGAATSGALLVTLACAAPAARAQTASDANSNDNAAAGGLQEVLVTAQRREESVQRSSLAIAVVSSDALQQAGVTQAAELASIVPGLSISMAGAAVQTYIRGVGNTGTDANAESAIAYSINGVYISRPSGIGPIFFDLDRVEVLKGPQGTLYGRNASGGAINLITRRPRSASSAATSKSRAAITAVCARTARSTFPSATRSPCASRARRPSTTVISATAITIRTRSPVERSASGGRTKMCRC